MKNENKIMADIRHNVSQKSQPIKHTPQNSKQPIRNSTINNNLVRKPIKNMDIARSSSISHFTKRAQIKEQTRQANHPAVMQKPAEIRVVPHPIVRTIQHKPIIETSSKTIKEAAIAEAFQKIAERQKQEKEALKKRNKIIRFIFTALVIVAIGTYFFLINLPSLSVSFANAKSGIEASLPSYCPDGYSRNSYARVEGSDVVIDYKSNNSDSSFNVKQSKSSWDSSAVRSMVDQASSGEFITTEESGLTIFSYGSNATWVNGGILYTITGDAKLSIVDIRQIALSL